MKNNILTLFLALVLMFPSCRKDSADHERPVIQSIELPLEEDTVFTGVPFQIKTHITDNQLLSQIKVSLNATSAPLTGVSNSRGNLNYIKIFDLQSQDAQFSGSITLPDSASGWQQFALLAVDGSGNVSESVKRNVYVQNNSDLLPPTFEIISPSNGTSYLLGTPINVLSTFSDNMELSACVFRFTQNGSEVFSKVLPLSGLSYTLNELLEPNLPVGDYTLFIYAYDQVRNSSFHTISVRIE